MPYCKAGRSPVARRQRGFSLLEAIVAMVLIATLGASLFSWLASSQASLYRVNNARLEQTARLNILEYCKALNPMVEQTGEHDFGAYRIRWTSEPLAPLQDGVGSSGGRGNYLFALYRLQIQAFQPATRTSWFAMDLRQVGYKKIRDTLPPP